MSEIYQQYQQGEDVISPPGASAMLELIWMGESGNFLELADYSINPGMLLIALAKKADRIPSINSKPPTNEEMIILARDFEPSRRMVDVACHIAVDQKLKDTFMKMVDQMHLGNALSGQATSAIQKTTITSAGNVDKKLLN